MNADITLSALLGSYAIIEILIIILFKNFFEIVISRFKIIAAANASDIFHLFIFVGIENIFQVSFWSCMYCRVLHISHITAPRRKAVSNARQCFRSFH